MNLNEALASLPKSNKGVVVIISGGMDSTIVLRLAVQKYGADKVHALSFNYGQRQKQELHMAVKTCAKLGIAKSSIVSLNFLQEFSQGFSANVDRSVTMPTIKDVLGDPSPKTYVPNRNMIMLSIAAAYAEVNDLDCVLCGLQVHDEYSYHDTTQEFVDGLNSVLTMNRKKKITILAPFNALNKYEEILILNELGEVSLLENTLTCYDPDKAGRSCGKCPSCSERIMNFAKAGFTDPVPYQISIPWGELIKEHYVLNNR